MDEYWRRMSPETFKALRENAMLEARITEAESEAGELKARLAIAEQREQAVRLVLRALTTSLRPFGFNRQRFLRCVREEGRDTPSEGPEAARHTVLEQEARRVLREAR